MFGGASIIYHDRVDGAPNRFTACVAPHGEDTENPGARSAEGEAGGPSRSSAMYAFLFLSQIALSSQRAAAGFRGSLAITTFAIRGRTYV